MIKRMEEKYIIRRTVLKILVFQGLLGICLLMFAYWLIH